MTMHLAARTRTLAAVGVTALALQHGATPALAHDVLEGSEPAAGETLSEAPEELVLTYSDEVQKVGNRVSVADASGEVVAEGEPTADGPVVTFDLPEHLEDGTYTSTWRVVSSDGHPISGTTDFTVAADSGGEDGSADASSTEESPAATESDSVAATESASGSDEADASAEPTESATTEATASPSDDAADAPQQDDEASGGMNATTWVLLGAVALGLLVGGGLMLRRR
ncbi:copper resistance protein CopC [Kytococcus sedentarius]|uniref:copper resistance protein CopC n=1 Tax=Kytococcus sedentarius TaxID=1276 RepID=UPI0035BC973E